MRWLSMTSATVGCAAALAFACGGQVPLGGPADQVGANTGSSSGGGAPGNVQANAMSGASGAGYAIGNGQANAMSAGSPGAGNASGSSGILYSTGPGNVTASADAVDAGPTYAGPTDAAAPVKDAAPIVIDAAPAPTGLAGFAFVLNGVIQSPLSCPSEHWEFAPIPDDKICPTIDGAPPNVCLDTWSAVIVNTSQVPLAYLALSSWTVGSVYVPGVVTGDPDQLAGVLGPGEQVDITSVYAGGVTAILGSSLPFSAADSSYAGDEGTIAWPRGVAGSNGSAQMNIAEIEVRSACTDPSQLW